MTTPAEILAKLAKGAPADELLRLLNPSSPEIPDELWRRCALVRSFDKELYDSHLAMEFSAPGFDEFAQRPEVERLPGERLHCYLKEDARKQYTDGWHGRDAELVQFSQSLVKYYLDRNLPLDVFAHRIFANPAAALDDFRRLYAAADKVFDLAACDSLLRILRNRAGLLQLSQPLREALADREQYLHSRTLFAEDYYRTLVYQQRNKPLEQFNQLLASADEWLLHIYGKGGMGKTQFLQWLIARRCVEENNGQRMAVARLDFDRLDLTSLSSFPWLILLRIAQQLTQQLPNNPFGSLLSSYERYAVLLDRPGVHGLSGADSTRATLAENLLQVAVALAQNIPDQFAFSLGTALVVVVLDTVEEPLLYQPVAFASILNVLDRTRWGPKPCPGLHLIISGRYNLADEGRLPSFMKAQEGRSRTVPIEEFTCTEARHYLTQLRRLPDDPLITAICERANGNPFELALFADLRLTDPSLTPEKIRDYPHTKYAYLIDRIIARIPEEHSAVQWLLRYAVIPRQLTRSFVADVLQPFMPQSGEAVTRRDDPNRFREELKQYEAKKPWKRYERVEVDKVWEELSLYASQYSWVSLQDGVVQLQPEVVYPMCLLLQENPVDARLYDDLHSAAADYFEQRAKAEPDRWGEWMSEAVYHHFQRDGLQAGEFWHSCLNDPHAQAVDVRERLAGTAVDRDFLEDKQPRAHAKTGTVVNWDILAQASFELAYAALLRRLRLKPGHPDAVRFESEIKVRWTDLQEYERQLGHQVIPSARRSLIALALRLFGLDVRVDSSKLLEPVRNFFQRVLRFVGLGKEGAPGTWFLSSVLKVVTDPSFLLTAYFLLAYVYSLKEPKRIDKYFGEAYELSARIQSTNLPPYYIDLLRGRSQLHDERLPGAVASLERSFKAMLNQNVRVPEMAEALRLLVEVALAAGKYALAAQYTVNANYARFDDDTRLWFQLHISKVSVGLVHGAVAAAYDWALTARQYADMLRDDYNAAAVQSEFTADAEAALMQFEQAEQNYHSAQSLFVSAGTVNGPGYCLVKLARMYTEGVGNFEAATRELERWSDQSPYNDPGLRIDYHMLRVECAALAGNDASAKNAWEVQRAGLEAEESNLRYVRVLVMGLALGYAEPGDDELLMKKLSQVEPVSARYSLLSGFRFFSGETGGSKVSRERLLKVVPRPEAKDPDFVFHVLHLADTLRFFGAAADATDLLRHAATATRTPYLLRQIRVALIRAQRDASTLQLNEEEFHEFLSHFNSYPILWGAALVEEGERAFALGAYSKARDYADQAQEKFTDTISANSQWHLRLAELGGQLARQERDYAAARRHFSRAQKMAADTGAKRAYERITRTIEIVQTNEARPRLSERDLLVPAETFELRLDTESLESKRTPVNADTWTRAIPIPSMLGGARGLLPAELIHFLQEPLPVVARRLSEILDPASDGGAATRVALKMAPNVLSTLPWELVFISGAVQQSSGLMERLVYRTAVQPANYDDTVRWIQMALTAAGQSLVIDGQFSPEMAAALSAFGGDEPFSPATVRRRLREAMEQAPDDSDKHRIMIIQRDLEEERSFRRGHGTLGIDLADIYRRNGFDVTRVRDTEPSAILEAIVMRLPAVIHIVSGFMESNDGEVFLDFSQFNRDAAGLLSARRLDSIIRQRPDNQLRPTVIVEGIQPPDQFDFARQILLRNFFCASLFAGGNTRAVLATGLAGDEGSLGTLLGSLVTGLAARGSLGTLHRRLLSSPIMTVAPSALFTIDPDLPAWR